MEFFITFLLVTVILLVALDTKSKTGLASLLIGFTVIGNMLAVYVKRFSRERTVCSVNLEDNTREQV